MDPTSEQQAAIDLFTTGKPLVIEAGAGTGKTTTLAMLARTTPRTGAYLAFNRAIAMDAGSKMPMTVDSRTVHSVAARVLRRTRDGEALLGRLQAPRMAPWQLARLMGIGPLMVTVGPRTKVLQPSWLAGHVMRAVARFCQSADDEPDLQHFPYVEGIDPPTDTGKRTWVNNRAVARELLPHLLDAWDDLTRPDGRLRFTHDVYLKLWQLNSSEIPGEFVLFDEAQDASPVMLAALAANTDKQVVYVGDSQQQIYEWRGAINALARVDGAERTFLTQSWRFGPDVADVANLVLEKLDADLRLTGTPSIRSTVWASGAPPRPRAILARSNGAAVNSVLLLQEQGLHAHLVGGADDIVRFATAADKLQAGQKTNHPELACFDSWREVQEYVEQDPQGDDLKMMVNLLDRYGISIVLDALDGLIAEQEADVIVSTAHKAKGREWDGVRLAGDFEKREGDLAAGEWRLLYVAATRAIEHLDVRLCEPLRDLVTPGAP